MNEYRSFDLRELPLNEAHAHLLGSVGPRPIAFASTVDAAGRVNLAPFSYFNVFSTVPPILGFSPARSGRTGLHKHTYYNAKATGEVVVNVVTHAIVHQSNLASSEFGEGVDEFVKAGLTAVPSEVVRPPRVGESPVQMECRVHQIVEFGEVGGAGSLILCEVLRLHVRADLLNARNRIDPERMDLVGRMGGEYYTRAHGAALFTVPRPQNGALGVDALPEAVRTSRVLTGADLAQLAMATALPDDTAVAAYREAHARELALLQSVEAYHRRAQRLLAEHQRDVAWLVLQAASQWAASGQNFAG